MATAKDMERALRDRGAGLRERATGLEEDVDRRRREFDAREQMREAKEADIADFREAFGEDAERLEEEQVARGRLGTGAGFRDADRLFRGFSDRLGRRFAQRAGEATALDLRNLEGMAGDQRFATTTDLDLATGNIDRQNARENFERERRKKRFGFLGGLAGGGLGFLLGGPAGATAGSKIGGTLADLFG